MYFSRNLEGIWEPRKKLRDGNRGVEAMPDLDAACLKQGHHCLCDINVILTSTIAIIVIFHTQLFTSLVFPSPNGALSHAP